MARLVSKVYGDALFSVALEEDKLEALWKEAGLLAETLTANPEFLPVLTHPEMTQEKQFLALDEVLKEKMSDEMMGFLHVLVKKGRIGEISAILDYFLDRVREYLKIGVVQVTTPIPLSDDQKQKVEKKLSEVSGYETLSMDYQIEESLLGGMIIRIGDRVLDNSIRTKLEMMSRKLNKVKLSN